MSKLATVNVYAPECLFFEMQKFRQNYVCWFSGPYTTRKMKFSNYRALEIQRNKFRWKTCFVEMGSRFYGTARRRSLQLIHQKISLFHIYMKHWIVGALVGFQNALRVRGVGYKFDISPLKITIQIGYSHLIIRRSPLYKFLQSLMINKKASANRVKLRFSQQQYFTGS